MQCHRPPPFFIDPPPNPVNRDPTRAMLRCIPACAKYSASVSPGPPAVLDSWPPTWFALPVGGGAGLLRARCRGISDPIRCK